MEKVVLDSSVIVKSILKPGRWLPDDIYERGLRTHHKAKAWCLHKRLSLEDILERLIAFDAYSV